MTSVLTSGRHQRYFSPTRSPLFVKTLRSVPNNNLSSPIFTAAAYSWPKSSSSEKFEEARSLVQDRFCYFAPKTFYGELLSRSVWGSQLASPSSKFSRHFQSDMYGKSCSKFSFSASRHPIVRDCTQSSKKEFVEKVSIEFANENAAGVPGTGMLMRVPRVSPSDDILCSSLKRAARVTPTKGLKVPLLKERNRSSKQLDALTTLLCKPLSDYIAGFPRSERLHPFERDLLELTFQHGQYQSTLRQINLLRKGLLRIGKQEAARAAKAGSPKEAIDIRLTGFSELQRHFKRGSHVIDELNEIAKIIRRLPVAELQTPMVALVGAPNVGKSSLVRVLSSGTPEVSNYPFTTRGIKMGHLFIENDRVLVTDTPGLLWRPVWTREHTEHFNTLHFKVQAENLKFEI
jgi:nucleolar GTP-binding protein|mmetsp:Transcript_9400/g.34186  ORF Transcript_9400/g.34186 Transcript_9400/m.34186 type:complete len:403 (-) Transcript_9400:2334-3542(-)|eukprot:31305-Pelagococcus_subviridis.AAC.10